MQILVTGGAGFIGSVVVRRAVSEGHFVTNYDALTAAASLGDIWDLEEADNYQLVLGYISDRNKLKKIDPGRPTPIGVPLCCRNAPSLALGW